jgi:hypothetical protein
MSKAMLPTPPAEGRYIRRMNPDQTVDSICRLCSQVVGHAPDEMKLDEYEAAHVCDAL